MTATRGVTNASIASDMFSFDWQVTTVWIVAAILAISHPVLISVTGSKENLLVDGRVEWRPGSRGDRGRRGVVCRVDCAAVSGIAGGEVRVALRVGGTP
jgi:hypothetical protein